MRELMSVSGQIGDSVIRKTHKSGCINREQRVRIKVITVYRISEISDRLMAEMISCKLVTK